MPLGGAAGSPDVKAEESSLLPGGGVLGMRVHRGPDDRGGGARMTVAARTCDDGPRAGAPDFPARCRDTVLAAGSENTAGHRRPLWRFPHWQNLLRYSAGLMPRVRIKARRIDSAVP